jgi:hypothetical protein
MVLSCATLPREDEIPEVVMDFKLKFPEAEVHTITSFDCRKSIPILNKNGFCVLPHNLFLENTIDINVTEENDSMKYTDVIHFCKQNKTLLRYFDLSEIIRCIDKAHEILTDPEDPYRISIYFKDISEITMNSLKIYYLEFMEYVLKFEKWIDIKQEIIQTQQPKFAHLSPSEDNNSNTLRRTYSVQGNICTTNENERKKSSSKIQTIQSADNIESMYRYKKKIEPHVIPPGTQGILLTTVDAYTLTDGPTIFIAENVENVANFFLKMSKIPKEMLTSISEKIKFNDGLLKEIEALDDIIQKELQVKDNSDKTQSNGKSSSVREKTNWNDNTVNLMDKINILRKKIQFVSMQPECIPNTVPHQKIWTPTREIFSNAFTAVIEEETVREIMNMDVEETFKIFALLGIGVLIKQKTPNYNEIIKRLANEQKLFLIIASSDYIYGTNYQFCHGIIGKDLTNMTPQKTLQAMGRIGRNNIQQEYTIRFREDDMIHGLFSNNTVNMEANVMNRLFSSI